MDKNQVKQLVLGYLNHYYPAAQKELIRIKKITDLAKRNKEAESAHNKYSSYSQLAVGYYNSYNLVGEINGDAISDYDKIVRELWNLSHETQDSQKQNQTNRLSHCVQCNKKNNFYHFIWDKRIKKLEKSYSNATDLNNEWVFCNQNCFNDWYKKWWSSLENGLKTLICKSCQKEFQVEREYKRGKEVTKNYDCCSQECIDNHNQIVIAWNTLILARKNLVVPNFPTFEELEEKQKAGELGTYVEQVKKTIVQTQQSKTEDNDNEKERIENDIIPQLESNTNKGNNNNTIEREREREREQKETIPNCSLAWKDRERAISLNNPNYFLKSCN